MNTNEPCAAVFPVDEDFMRLPNNDVIQLEGRQQKITYYLTLGGWNISSPNHIINVIDKFDFSQLDVLVLVNSYHFLEHRVIEDIIRIAAQNNIEIYWATPDYLYYTLCYKKQIKEIELLTVGAVQSKLPMYNIQSMKILVPPTEVIEDFQHKFDIFNEQIEANTIEIQRLYELQSVLLAKLAY